MKILVFLSSLLALLVAVSGCREGQTSGHVGGIPPCPDASCYFIDGKLNQTHVDGILERAESLELVIIRSVGGKNRFARKIASVILERNVDLVIVDECSSACFEYFVLAASSVTAINQPVIAIHGNPITTNILLEREGHFHLDHCPWPSLPFLKNLQANKGVSDEYNREVLRRLGEIRIEFTHYENGCLSSYNMQSEFDYWEPTRSEIATYFNVNVIGELCRDKRETCL